MIQQLNSSPSYMYVHKQLGILQCINPWAYKQTHTATKVQMVKWVELLPWEMEIIFIQNQTRLVM